MAHPPVEIRTIPPPLASLGTESRVHVAAFLVAAGQADERIADLFGLKTLKTIRGSQYFERLVKDALNRRHDSDWALASLRGVALIRLLELIASPNPTVALRAVETLLDRLGLPGLSKITPATDDDGAIKLTETRTRQIEFKPTDEERLRLVERLRFSSTSNGCGASLPGPGVTEGADS